MAQYDGSIRIKTEINTRNAEIQLSSLENRMVKTSDKIASLRSKIDSLKDVKIPTQEYQNLQKELDNATKKYDELSELVKTFQKTGTDPKSMHFRRAQDEAQELYMKIEDIRGAMFELEESGKAFSIADNTQKIENLSNQLKYAESDLSQMQKKHDLLLLKQKQNSDAYSDMEHRVDKVSRKASVLSKTHSVMKTAIDKVKAGYKKLSSVAKNAFSRVNRSASKSNGLLSTMGTRLKSLVLSILIFNQIRKAFNTMASALKDGYRNLYNDNERFKNSVDNLKASAATLKNALAAAFSPLVEIAIPYIQQTIDYMVQLLNIVGQFFSALTGQESYTRAVKQTTDALEDETKASNKQLSSLDKLNNLSSQSGGTSSGSGTKFEEVPLPERYKNVAQSLREMWENSDFYDLGKLLGEKINDALKSISWNEIKESAKKIAKSIASFINGFIETENLGYSIGNTLAQSINTAFAYLNTFVHRIHWSSIGKFVGESFNGFFDNIDWEQIYDTFVTGFRGLAESINSFIHTFKWDNVSTSIRWIVKTFSDSLTELFKTTEWKEVGSRIGEQIELLLKDKEMWHSVGSSIGSGLQAAFDFVKGMISEIHFEDVVSAIKEILKGLFENFDNGGELALIILGVISAKLALKASAALFKGPSKSIGDAISLSLTKYALPVIGSAVAGWKLGNMVGRQLFGDDAYDDFSWTDFFGSLNAEDFIGAMEEMSLSGSEAAKTILDAFRPIGPMLMSMTDDTKSWFDKITESILQQNDNVVGSCAIAGATIVENFDNIDSSQQKLSQKTDEVTNEISGYWNDATSSMSSIISGATRGIETSFSSTYKSVIASTESFVRDLKRKLKSVSGAASGSVLGGAVATYNLSNPAVASLASLDIPGYATGQVIPTSMKKHLAILGDNNKETEIVSPVSTIEQAVDDVLDRRGYRNGDIVIQIDGREVFRVTQKQAQEYYKQTGSYAFT